MTEPNPILATALELHEAGYAVIPIRPDGSKSPAIPWKPYTLTPPTQDDVRAWFTNPGNDVGVIQGTVSGNAELTEIEGRATNQLPDLKTLAHDTGLGHLWDTITTGWLELSPSGGLHFHYRVNGPVPGNTKLARTPDHTVLVETRGEGGQVVVAPSSHHASGRPWVRLLGGPATAPTLTLEQRDQFHTLLRTLDQTPPAGPPAPAPVTRRDPADGLTPGDDYENRTTWADILTPHGWTPITTRGRTTYWRRPGKTEGISATTGHADDRDRLYVFSTSTPFDTERPYTKFGAHAVLEHGGDHAAAARHLASAGYGTPREHPRTTRTDLEGLIAPTEQHTPIEAVPAGHQGEHAPTLAAVDEPTTYSPTDDGNALRLVDTHEGTIRYVPQLGTWLTWNGHRWARDEAGHVRELARSIARNLPDDDKTEHRHKAASLSRRGIEAMTALAQTDRRTVTHLNTLDARPYELNTPGGVINLRTGHLTPPDPAALHTRTTTTTPNPDHTPHRWLTFLADTFAGDPDLTTYIQRLLGISLIGTVLEQLLPFAHGPGANGKTTMLGVIQRLIGIGDHGYSISAPAEMLLASHQQGHPTEIARLAGARLVVTSELEDGQRFAEARIKQLTGRDVISGRFMRQDWFSFTPTHTLWLLANHQPSVRAGGPAFWRRLRLLPFAHTVPPEKRIPDLEDRLVEEEGPGILAWVIQGAADYHTHGLAEPDSVRAATDAYATDQDTIGRFITERCELGPTAAQHMNVRVTQLRQAYETWCRVEGEEPVTAKALTTALVSRFGVVAGRTTSSRHYSGIRLTEPSSDDAPTAPDEPAWYQQEGW